MALAIAIYGFKLTSKKEKDPCTYIGKLRETLRKTTQNVTITSNDCDHCHAHHMHTLIIGVELGRSDSNFMTIPNFPKNTEEIIDRIRQHELLIGITPRVHIHFAQAYTNNPDYITTLNIANS